MHHDSHAEHDALTQERSALLQQLEAWLETPMLVLALVWLALLVLEVLSPLPPLLEAVGIGIWGLFLLDFVLRFTLAPQKGAYLLQNWLTVLALLVPALRVVRLVRIVQALRVARAARGLRLLRLLSGLNRSMRALRASMSRRGVGYVLALTLVVTLVGAAGMYAFAVFGYVTATLTTFLIGRDAAREDAELASAQALEALRADMAALRAEVQALVRQHTPS
jgi:voltage-gated potassium channel